MSCTVVGVDNAGKMVFPLCLLFLMERSEHLEQRSIQAFDRVSLRMVRSSSGVRNSCQLLESLKQGVLELPALVMVKLLRVPEAWNEIVEDLFSRCFASLISSWVGLSKTGEVIYYNKDVLIASFTGIEMHIVDREQLKRGTGCD